MLVEPTLRTDIGLAWPGRLMPQTDCWKVYCKGAERRLGRRHWCRSWQSNILKACSKDVTTALQISYVRWLEMKLDLYSTCINNLTPSGRVQGGHILERMLCMIYCGLNCKVLHYMEFVICTCMGLWLKVWVMISTKSYCLLTIEIILCTDVFINYFHCG